MKYKVSVIKKIAFLVMTMALAVAMVACSGAVGTKGEPGPAGPAGPAGTTDPTDPTDPPTTVEPGPVQIVTGIDDLVFNDSVDGTMDAMSQSVNIADHFYPAGLDYSYAPTDSDLVDVTLADGTLAVMLKSGAMYQNNKITAKATDGTSSHMIGFHARRNRPPVKSTGEVAGIDVAGVPLIMGRAVAAGVITVWVGTTEPLELTIDPDGTADTTKKGDIPVKIGVYDADDIADADAYFFDDDGNTLSLMPEPLGTADAKKLTVTGGSKVTLVGMTSTDADPEVGIPVQFTAMDDNGLSSASESHVLNVKIDAAPTNKGTIGTRVVKLSTGAVTAMVADIGMYFDDDRQPPDADAVDGPLVYYIWSDAKDVALVKGNPDNKIMIVPDADGEATNGYQVVINAVDPGTATIMVKAMEPREPGEDEDDDDDAYNDTAGLEQYTMQEFDVVVQLD